MTFIPCENVIIWNVGESHIFNIAKASNSDKEYMIAFSLKGKQYLEIKNHAEFLIAFEGIEKQTYSYAFMLNDDETVTVDVTKKYDSVSGYMEAEQ